MTTASLDRAGAAAPRHARFVRITHWLTTAAFVALLVSGIEVLLSHPRFTGERWATAPVPDSRR